MTNDVTGHLIWEADTPQSLGELQNSIPSIPLDSVSGETDGMGLLGAPRMGSSDLRLRAVPLTTPHSLAICSRFDGCAAFVRAVLLV